MQDDWMNARDPKLMSQPYGRFYRSGRNLGLRCAFLFHVTAHPTSHLGSEWLIRADLILRRSHPVFPNDGTSPTLVRGSQWFP